MTEKTLDIDSLEFTALCNECTWQEVWSNRAAAESAAVWHVHDDHPDLWDEHLWSKRLVQKQTQAYLCQPAWPSSDLPDVPRPETLGTKA